MKKIYLDQASTTYPKPECVAKAVYEYMTGNGSNINRGCYENAYDKKKWFWKRENFSVNCLMDRSVKMWCLQKM